MWLFGYIVAIDTYKSCPWGLQRVFGASQWKYLQTNVIKVYGIGETAFGLCLACRPSN